MKKLFIVVTISVFVIDILFAQKKDVIDPLLQSIIDYFTPKLPKFLDKYGRDRFVADEPITRGSLLFALYEFEQSLIKGIRQVSTTSASTETFITKQELDTIRRRLSSLEERLSSDGGLGNKSIPSKSTQINIFDIINDLTPNMPMLLDSTLTKSEVFKNLKKEVEDIKYSNLSNVSASNISLDKKNVSSELILENSKQILMLDTRVNKLEKSLLDTGGKVENLFSSLKKNYEEDKLKKDMIESVVSRLEKLEKNMNFSKDASALSKPMEPKNQDNFSLLITRLDNLEKNFEEFKRSEKNLLVKNVEASYVDLRQVTNLASRLDKLEKNLQDINYKIGNLPKNTEVAKDIKEYNTSRREIDSIGENFSILTKLSLGVSMLALLFVAR